MRPTGPEGAGLRGGDTGRRGGRIAFPSAPTSLARSMSSRSWASTRPTVPSIHRAHRCPEDITGNQLRPLPPTGSGDVQRSPDARARAGADQPSHPRGGRFAPRLGRLRPHPRHRGRLADHFTMITPYENRSPGPPRFMHLLRARHRRSRAAFRRWRRRPWPAGRRLRHPPQRGMVGSRRLGHRLRQHLPAARSPRAHRRRHDHRRRGPGRTTAFRRRPRVAGSTSRARRCRPPPPGGRGALGARPTR